jgi:ABC-type transport system substrate-binding protein
VGRRGALRGRRAHRSGQPRHAPVPDRWLAGRDGCRGPCGLCRQSDVYIRGSRRRNTTVGEVYLPGTSTSIDPANQYDFWTGAPERFVYDGLVRYALVDGLAGFTLLVPDLAARMPTVSADGRTYTFDLRTGIRYSTGRTVTATDFARGFRRVFTIGGVGGNPALLRGVVGADACLAHPARCDLSHGVIADDAHHRLTIHLTAPDADFLGRLTYFVYPAPPGTPSGQLTTPLPATGPYKIAGVHHRRDKSGRIIETTFDTLVRNPYFRQWSFAAQPAGYPDVMRWRAFDNSQDAIKAVLDGQLDIGGHRSSVIPADSRRCWRICDCIIPNASTPSRSRPTHGSSSTPRSHRSTTR